MSIIVYQKVDFHSAPPRSIKLNVEAGPWSYGPDGLGGPGSPYFGDSPDGPLSVIEVHIDDPNSPPIATVPVSDTITGNPAKWMQIAGWPVEPVTGTHDVYLKVVAPKGKEYGPTTTPNDLVSLDWFSFEW
ncbi:carbohydrate-binding protein [Saccharopolyspora shandongensis]|uniref:carbohydrate-binding protein n=1 Tax=Saccharopolyspora shandongensis TaxID=418495 RepID=UPI0033E90F00